MWFCRLSLLVYVSKMRNIIVICQEEEQITCPMGYSGPPTGGACFKLSNELQSYVACALEECGPNGTLASIRNFKEFHYVISILKRSFDNGTLGGDDHISSGAFIGIYEDDGYWRNVDGSYFGFSSWSENEPQEICGDERVVYLDAVFDEAYEAFSAARNLAPCLCRASTSPSTSFLASIDSLQSIRACQHGFKSNNKKKNGNSMTTILLTIVILFPFCCCFLSLYFVFISRAKIQRLYSPARVLAPTTADNSTSFDHITAEPNENNLTHAQSVEMILKPPVQQQGELI